MSIGALQWAMDNGALDHDVLLWTEDDYLFGQHDFDAQLVNRLRDQPGMVCGKWMSDRQIAAVLVGAFSTKALREIAPLPVQPNDYGACAAQSHIPWAIRAAGFGVGDWLDEWATAYRSGHGNRLLLEWFGPTDRPSFVLPIQAIDKPAEIANQDRRAVLGWDGVLR
jgi:hypothetical protein